MQVTNPFSRTLTIAATGQTVGPGEAVEVDDDLGRHLLDQGWKPKTKTKPAAADDTED